MSRQYLKGCYSEGALYRHSLRTVAPTNFICVSVCVSVCPAFLVYILLTMGWNLIKLGENVGTSVRLNVLNFIKIGLVLK